MSLSLITVGLEMSDKMKGVVKENVIVQLVKKFEKMACLLYSYEGNMV